MTAPFRLDEQVTIERRAAKDPDYGTDLDEWEVVVDRSWANAQDILPSRSAEAQGNGVITTVTRTRLRIQIDVRVTTAMRVRLHGRGDRLMQIVAGPALLDDRRHVEFMLEGYSHG